MLTFPGSGQAIAMVMIKHFVCLSPCFYEILDKVLFLDVFMPKEYAAHTQRDTPMCMNTNT